ncbi:D-alanyl-D-alanine carboxypeptidase [Viridibacillus sp. YIM B01967]|uniref:D-alanyl-D-alanine carboxypeptidase n=2 Tax=Viridibacillus soli TaxID=2798301 RepID=A0ABS1H4C2_9BACL|nr:D-alanyl-D-alanine carboxypeptidase [Viridibacillus soli]
MVVLLLINTSPSSAASHSYAVIDAETGRLLLGANEHTPLPIASLTKMWTALVALENMDLQAPVTVSKQAAMSEGSSIYLTAGEETTLETLLYGLLLRSGNDAAAAIAEACGGSLEGFSKMMNDTAALYGLEHTHFENPSGLHNEQHLASAYDTAQMLRIAMQNKKFKKIASTKNYSSNTVNGTVWENKHKLVRNNKFAIAGKTGYTKVAGRTLATYFEKDGKKVIVVTINESNDWLVHSSHAEYVFKNYRNEVVAKSGTYSVQSDIRVNLADSQTLLLTKQEEKSVQHILQLPRAKSQDAIGRWSFYIGDNLVKDTLVEVDWR